MNTKKKTIQEIVKKQYEGMVEWNDNATEEDKREYMTASKPYRDKLIAEIQALVKEAIPEKIVVAKTNHNNPVSISDVGEERGFNIAIDTITTALVERGLLKGEEE